ncbi:MAG: ATP-grasp domain-containing protein [Candidatus Heimdallarchaeota archaeon]
MKLLISGFNARPIAKAATEAGYDIGTVDYFGDMDLLKLSRNCFSVLRQKPGQTLHRPLHRIPAEYLYYLSEIMSDEQDDFDGILLGSAFDRFPDLIKKFDQLGPKLFANKPEKFALMREREKMYGLAEQAGFSIPKSNFAPSFEELIEFAKNYSYPVVTRGDGGGGGFGIRYWDNIEDLKLHFQENFEEEDTGYWIQEHIKGIDASSTVICSKNLVQIISVNRQLIGDKNLGSPGDFSYCGNIVPLDNKQFTQNKELQTSLLESIRALFKKIDLIGTNGIDFVIKNNKVYFMEINPRFQGSIECVQYATGYNLVKLHIDAFNNIIHDIPEIPNYKKSAIKGILFSNSEENFSVKKYPRNKWIVDRTHFDVILENNDPFCSIVMPTNSSEEGYKKMRKIAEKTLSINKN